MSTAGGRSFLASVVGWLIVAIIVFALFGWVIGFVGFLVRIALFVIVIGALLTLYFKIRGD